MITELESQLDYERLRREKLESELDDFKRENAYLSNNLQNALYNNRTGSHSAVRYTPSTIKGMRDMILHVKDR